MVQECYEAKIRYHCYWLHFDMKKVPFLGIFGRWLLYIEDRELQKRPISEDFFKENLLKQHFFGLTVFAHISIFLVQLG